MKVSRTSKSSRPLNNIQQGKNRRNHPAYIEGLEKSNASQLKTDENEATRMLSISIVYDKLQKMKDEYKHFYGEEQGFEDAWIALQEDPDHFVEHLLEIFDCHNHVVEALLEFDKTFETNHNEALINFIMQYEVDFTAISLVIQPDSSLRVRKRKLKEHFKSNPEAFAFLTGRRGFLRKLFEFYHSLKAVKPPTTKDEDQLAWYQGLFVDRKA